MSLLLNELLILDDIHKRWDYLLIEKVLVVCEIKMILSIDIDQSCKYICNFTILNSY